ncbi:MAG UNVERIFIED_CONTAM: 3,4-dihydroxy-2-butanone-4-phosphate synthase, partial [Thermobifida fusca]
MNRTASPIPLDDIDEALKAIAAGRPVVVVDDADRENEGDLVFAADAATPELLAFMIRHTSGVVCVPMLGEDLDRLNLPLMTPRNEDRLHTAYTVTVDARTGVHTGISAADRSRTVRLLADAASVPGDFTRPGHVFPLRYRPGGVLVRRGHTEAAVDLARLAGRRPAGVIAEIVNDDGSMARLPRLREFADEHGLRLVAVEQLVELADDVRAILGASTKISYAADWSEYFGHHPQDGSGDVYFHLDPLWASSNIDFVGIDNYMPLSDWRDGYEHLDAQEWESIYQREYLQSNIEGGEGFDWYYASAADRDAQNRTPITDGAYGKPWVFRFKDVRAWWSNPHFNRPGGIESGTPTA